MSRTLIYFLLFIVTNNLVSQTYDRSYLHHDIMASYGLPATDLFVDINSTMLNEKFPDRRYVRDNYRGSGVVSVSYRRVSKNELMLWGISAAYCQTTGDIYNVGHYEGELNRRFITIAVDGQYRYQNMNKIQLYSGLGIGYSFGSETLNPLSNSGSPSVSGSINRIAWQINAIGVRIGDSIAGTVEFGYGYKGIVNVGLSIQLY
ncbi:MAG: hypothetical protein H8E34_07020 [Bacteroidetes bacterium]|nr:hypothetical protein [Bacteroidota bacterium]MBL6944612.1 hypothetical protein [Bacteroidales bacterium]